MSYGSLRFSLIVRKVNMQNTGGIWISYQIKSSFIKLLFQNSRCTVQAYISIPHIIWSHRGYKRANRVNYNNSHEMVNQAGLTFNRIVLVHRTASILSPAHHGSTSSEPVSWDSECRRTSALLSSDDVWTDLPKCTSVKDKTETSFSSVMFF